MSASSDFARPILSVDIVPLTLRDGRLWLLRMIREAPPFAGEAALIGGFVHVDDDASLGETARRVLREKAGIHDLYVEQLSTFSGPSRDPRGWSASTVYFALCPPERLEEAAMRAGLELVPASEAGGMVFDHDLILGAALARLSGKGAYSDLPARLLGPEFTLSELHRTYCQVLGEEINIDAFRRKVLERGFLEETGAKRLDPGARRPGRLYRLAPGHAVFDRRV